MDNGQTLRTETYNKLHAYDTMVDMWLIVLDLQEYRPEESVKQWIINFSWWL